MVIDIDSFLDKFEKGDQKVITKKVSLDFQKDVEDRITQVQNDSKGKDIDMLRDIYDEVKKFNEDLPSKFLGLEGTGGYALKDLGERYSDDFFKINLDNAKLIKNSIYQKLSELDIALETLNFTKILEIYKKIQEEFSYFPKSLLNEKIELGREIKLKEIEIFKILDDFKKNKVEEYKNKFSYIFNLLKKEILSKNTRSVEENVKLLEETINSIPKIILSNLIQERIMASQFLIKAETYLLDAYNREFEEKYLLINSLFEKFHSKYVKKDINEVLLIYNEILYEFKAIPDFFFEKKLEIYKQINIIFTNLNKLMINRNVFMLIESYEYGKRIESIRSYLNHANNSGIYNGENLIDLKSKVDSLPQKFLYEKEDLLKEINFLIKKSNSQIKNTNENNSESKIEFNLEDMPKKAIINNSDPNSDTFSNINFNNDKYVKEVEMLYKRFKVELDPNKIKLIYKKIISTLNYSTINPQIKAEIIKMVNKSLYEKKLI